jgi:hypothetical protein
MPLRRHLNVRRAEMQCERIRKLISRWHRDELEYERRQRAGKLESEASRAVLGLAAARGSGGGARARLLLRILRLRRL